jgi:regulatory protein
VPTSLSLKGRALKHLAAREHSRSELRRKLAPHAEDDTDVERVLDELQDRGFLSEERFVESLVHRRSARHGVARIRQELGLKGISPDQMREPLAALEASELARAHAVWARRFGTLPEDPRDHARQTRFLMARGFSGEVVRRVLKGEAPEAPPDGDAMTGDRS